jgi:hypothetical protein
MDRCIITLIALMMIIAPAFANITLASSGKAKCIIYVDQSATETEKYAANELADHLKKITGAEFTVTQQEPSAELAAIVVGPSKLAQTLAFELSFDKLGLEDVVIRTKGNHLLLAGGKPRGTLYAVYRFLYTQCGVRWFAPWETKIPQKKTLTIKDLNSVEKPSFEARDPFWFCAFDGDWAARNYSNSEHARLTEKHGGAVTYKGFVHTVTSLVPPEKYFEKHPEWFAVNDGKRLGSYWTQLCLTNPEVKDVIVEQVRAWLRENPKANILSVSQNDSFCNCQCDKCKVSDEYYGSPAGTMLNVVNYVADKIKDEFPNVAIDTLAYQYTRKAPKNIKPLPNVIIRLCSIECNFAEPLTDDSNKTFAQDIIDWGKICNRIYIWDYTTNFAHYVQPHPNWFVEGPNIRFFRDNGAKGMFEEGAYQSFGSEMEELRAWVEAQLLWNPDQDDKALIKEFLAGYYGKAAGPIYTYMQLLSKETKGYYMGCYSSPSAPFLRFEMLAKAEDLWKKAEEAVKGNEELTNRVRMGRLPLRYVWLTNWIPLRRECLKTGAKWPIPSSRKAVAADFLKTCEAKGLPNHFKVTILSEGSLTPQAFVDRYKEDAADPIVFKLPQRPSNVAPPADLTGIDPSKCVDAQDGLANLAKDGEWIELRPDKRASDGIAAFMPSTHYEWAFSMPTKKLSKKVLTGKWKVYVVVRTDQGSDSTGDAFTTGVYDVKAAKGLADTKFTCSQTGNDYKSFLVGTVKLTASSYVWVAPVINKAVNAVWVDRVYLVPASD